MAKIKFRTPRQKAKEFCEHLRTGMDSKGNLLEKNRAAYRAGYVDGRGETLTSISYAQARRDGKLAAWKQKQKPFNDKRKARQKQSRERKRTEKEYFSAAVTASPTTYNFVMRPAMEKAEKRALAQGATGREAIARAQRAAIEAVRHRPSARTGKKNSKTRAT